MFDLTTVGHFAIDLIVSPRIACPRETLGGPPTFSSMAARELGAEVSVVSKVGWDFPSEYTDWLTRNGIDLTLVKRVSDAPSTHFVLEYEGERRRLQLKSRAPSIEPSDIPESLESRAIHAAPIANELSSESIGKLRGLTEVLSLDPQGIVREFDRKGNTSLRRMESRQILKRIDILKSAMDEFGFVLDVRDMRSAFKKIHEYGVDIIIVTEGIKGVILSHKGRICEVPACKPKVFISGTGAGDAFMGAFLAEYVRGEGGVWCACVGSAAASFVVEGLGPARFGEKREIYERASEVFEKLKTFKL